MDGARVRRRINEYLAREWGLVDDSEPPDERWPFDLTCLGRIGDTDYYGFDDLGEAYYVTISVDLVCAFAANGRAFGNLRAEAKGTT